MPGCGHGFSRSYWKHGASFSLQWNGESDVQAPRFTTKAAPGRPETRGQVAVTASSSGRRPPGARSVRSRAANGDGTPYGWAILRVIPIRAGTGELVLQDLPDLTERCPILEDQLMFRTSLEGLPLHDLSGSHVDCLGANAVAPHEHDRDRLAGALGGRGDVRRRHAGGRHRRRHRPATARPQGCRWSGTGSERDHATEQRDGAHSLLRPSSQDLDPADAATAVERALP